MKVNALHHVAISVKNLKKSIDFYTNTFGFEKSQEFERKDLHGKAAFLSLGNTFIEIWEVENVQNPIDKLTGLGTIGIRHFALSVNDLDEAYTLLKEKTDISKPILGASGKRLSFLTDPDGIHIELYEEKEN